MFGDQMTLKCIVVDADNYNQAVTNTYQVKDRDFSLFDYSANRATYIGPDHSTDSRQIIQLSRGLATVNGNYRGSYKCGVKTTLDVPVEGRDGTSIIKSPLILNLESSIPVGTPAHVIRNSIYQLLAVLGAYHGGLCGPGAFESDELMLTAIDNERLGKINAFFTSQLFAG